MTHLGTRSIESATGSRDGAPADEARRRIIAAATMMLIPGTARAQPAAPRVVYVPSPGWFAYRDSASLRERQHDFNASLFAKEGFVAGRGFILESAHAESPRDTDVDRLARQVIASAPALVLLSGDCVREFMRHTSRIPLVFYNLDDDPVRMGIVQSLARPGGNVTGTALTSSGEAPKGWELLKELSPGAKRLGILWYAADLADPLAVSWRKRVEPAASRLGLTIVDVVIPSKVTARAFERTVKAAGVDVLDATGLNDEASLPDIIEFLRQARLPALWLHAELVRRGGLLSSDFSRGEGLTEAVKMAALVLRGESPSTLPVRVPRRYVTAINTGTARAMGLVLPQSVLLRADVVVE
jgi:putative ABC transport system substrate-binding protein